MTEFLEIEVHEKDPEGNLLSRTMYLNPDNILSIIRQPLQPAIITCLGVNLMTQSHLPDEIKGLIKVETFENGIAYFRPSAVVMYYTPELGKYTLLFPGGTQIALKETGERVKQLLAQGPNIEL